MKTITIGRNGTHITFTEKDNGMYDLSNTEIEKIPQFLDMTPEEIMKQHVSNCVRKIIDDINA